VGRSGYKVDIKNFFQAPFINKKSLYVVIKLLLVSIDSIKICLALYLLFHMFYQQIWWLMWI